MIDSGELREKLEIIAKIGEEYVNGFPVQKSETLYTLRCKRKTISTKEYIGSDRQISELTYKFICRRKEIDSSMYVKYKEKLFNIKHVHEIDVNFMEITAAETQESE